MGKVPIGAWPKDLRLKEQGRWLQAQMLDSIEPISLGYCSRILKWSDAKTQVFMAGVRNEFLNHKTHLFVYCYIWKKARCAKRRVLLFTRSSTGNRIVFALIRVGRVLGTIKRTVCIYFQTYLSTLQDREAQVPTPHLRLRLTP